MWSKYPSIDSLHLNSIVASALLRPSLSGGANLVLKGYATPHISSQIAAMEVSIDAGASWAPARITYQEGKWSWTIWEAVIPGAPEHGKAFCRAIDKAGITQQPECKWNLRGVAYNPWGVKAW